MLQPRQVGREEIGEETGRTLDSSGLTKLGTCSGITFPRAAALEGGGEETGGTKKDSDGSAH